MKISMTRLYRAQIMKPLVNKIMSLQLLIERELLPRLEDEVDWNQNLFQFGMEEYARARQQARYLRNKESS